MVLGKNVTKHIGTITRKRQAIIRDIKSRIDV